MLRDHMTLFTSFTPADSWQCARYFFYISPPLLFCQLIRQGHFTENNPY